MTGSWDRELPPMRSSSDKDAPSSTPPLSTAQPSRAALLTAEVPSAIATIAASGPAASRAIAAAFRSPHGRTVELSIGEARFGTWQSPAQASIPPEHVVLFRAAACDFEIHCHGGLAVRQLILGDLLAAGCDKGHASQWPSVAASGGELEAAAEAALQRAATSKVAAILLDQAQGCLRRELAEAVQLLQAGQSQAAMERCEQLLARAAFGMRLADPWTLTLAGPPNAGKSSLTNALIGTSRVLVHHEPGTTRDAIDTAIVVAAWPIVITDTAGLRTTDEFIEQKGIETAWQRWQRADIGLLVVDATVGWTAVHDQLAQQRGSRPSIIVLNKHDLRSQAELPAEALRRVSGLLSAGRAVKSVPTRATDSDGVGELLAVLGNSLDALAPAAGAGVPFLAAQARRLEEAIEALRADRPQAALECLRQLLR